ncbi:retrotransposon protein, putative, ty1-copia subclass [Tanacetum coccineum]
MSTENGVNPPAPNPAHNSNFSLLLVLGRERLTGPNYMDWMRNLRFTLRYENKEYVLDEQILTINDDSTQEEIKAHQNHYDDTNKVSCIMASSMNPELQKTFENTWAYEINQQLKEMFQAKSSKERLDVVKSLMACKPKPEASIYAFVLEMKGYFDRLESLNMVFDVELSINIILSSLPADYNQFVLLYQINEKETSIMELHSFLQTAEQGIKKIDVPSTSEALVLTVGHNAKKRKTSHSNWKGKAIKGKSNRGSKRKAESDIAPTSNPKEAVCFYCNTKGHWKRSYPKYLKDLKDGKLLIAKTYMKTVECISHNGNVILNVGSSNELDKSKLWYSRLGNVNKKRIAQLQKDGMLESFDFKSNDVCESCLLGKMTKSPFIGSCERGEGLLDLVHTNVCGPFRSATKDRKRYYVMFTDDFSRYAYVYLIKHKSGTFEVFKRYQNEVENQLGRKIKSADEEPIMNTDTQQEVVTPVEPDDISLPIRRTIGRVSKPTQFYYGFHIEEDKISDSTLSELDEPANYKEAMANPEAAKWKEAIKSEIQSMYDNQVWNLVDTTPGLKTVGCKWIFKKKTDMDGKVHTYKARLVVNGYTQTHRIDDEETFSPVAKIKSVRIMLAITAFHDYEIWQMDVKTAFLNRKLTEDVFMAQPEGFENAKYPKRVCKLQRPFMDLKRLLVAGIYASMRKSHSLDFLEAKMSHGYIYIKFSGSVVVFLVLYVDDILLIGNDIPTLQSVKEWLGKCFAMKDLGDAAYVLGSIMYAMTCTRPDVSFALIMKILKQDIVADSTCESEYIAACKASKEAIWMKNFIGDLGVVPIVQDPIEIFCDNKSAVALTKEPKDHGKLKHIERKYHFVRSKVKEGHVIVKHIRSEDNPLDPFKKALAKSRHDEHARSIGLKDNIKF